MLNCLYKDCPGEVLFFSLRFEIFVVKIQTDCRSIVVKSHVLNEDIYKFQFYFSPSCRLSENRRATKEGKGTDRAACVCREQERPAGTVRGLATSTVSH